MPPPVKTALSALATNPVLPAVSLPSVQTIWFAKVEPRAKSVRISFDTLHACVPVIELYHDAPNMSFAVMKQTPAFKVVFPFLSGYNAYHSVEFDELPE